MYSEVEAKKIAEDNLEGYIAEDCELFGDNYIIKMVGGDGVQSIDSIFYTVNKNTGEFKVRNITELAKIIGGR